MPKVKNYPTKEIIELTLLILSGKLDEVEDYELVKKIVGGGGNKYALLWRASKQIIKDTELFARLKNN